MATDYRIRESFAVWGTVIYFDCAPNYQDFASILNMSQSEFKKQFEKQFQQIEIGLSKVKEYFEKVDQIFSTYKPESEVSRFRTGELSFAESCDDFQSVYLHCEKLKKLTFGAFDPWAAKGGYDPSGYVKGWACDKGIEILKEHGAGSIQINGAGDLSLYGGYPTLENPNSPWQIGIRDPEDALTVVKVFEIFTGAIATSGSYERGGHIIDPETGTVAIGALSATVYGPVGAVADALATALMVAGKDGAKLFMQEEFAEYGAWVIERHTRQAWGIKGANVKA